MPSGRLWAVKASKATAWMAMERLGVPRTWNDPPTSSRSSSDASIWWAAMARALPMTFSVACHTATPPTARDRDP